MRMRIIVTIGILVSAGFVYLYFHFWNNDIEVRAPIRENQAFKYKENKPILTTEILKNFSYSGGMTTLHDGIYYKTDVHNGNLVGRDYYIKYNQALFGEINYDGRQDAAVILEESMGKSKGVFLVFVLSTEDGWKDGGWFYLGEGTQVKKLFFEDKEAVGVEMLIQDTDDLPCCPTKLITRRFSVIGPLNSIPVEIKYSGED